MLDKSKPYDLVYGACEVVVGARFLQDGIYYSGEGQPLADIDGNPIKKPKAKPEPVKPSNDAG